MSRIRLGTITLLVALPLFLSLGFCIFVYKISTCPPINKKALSLKNISTVVVFSGTSKRLHASLHLLKKKPIQDIFISGVNHCVHPKRLLLFYAKNKNNQTRVNLGYKAKNTLENALETKEWLEKNNISTFYLITSYYHMPRSFHLMKSALPKATIIPISVHPSHPPLTLEDWIQTIKTLSYEYIKYLGSFIQVLKIRYFI